MIIKIAGYTFEKISIVSLLKRYDSVSSAFNITFDYDESDKRYNELFSPFKNSPVKIYSEENELLFTGNIYNNVLRYSNKIEPTNVSGFSKTKVLELSNPLPSSFPLQFKNLTVKQLCEKLCSPFGINVVLGHNSENANNSFAEFNFSETSSVLSILQQVCSQNNLLVKDNSFGELVITGFYSSKKATYSINENMSIQGLEVEINANSMQVSSSISILGNKPLNSKSTTNEYLESPFFNNLKIHKTKIQNRSDVSNSKDSAKNELLRQAKSIVMKITLDDFFLNGKFIKEGNFIAVDLPKLFLNKNSQWFIESAKYERNINKKRVILQCTPADVYFNGDFKNLFLK